MQENRNHWFKWPIIIVGIVVVIAAAGWYFGRNKTPDIEYQTAPVERGDITNTVTATGTLNPVVNVQVGCQVSGRIAKLYVDYNSKVTNGELIAEIDPRTYLAQLSQADADLSNARANLELQAVQARRASELYTNHLISASDYDTAVASWHQAEAMVQIKEASLTNATANLGYCKIYSPVDGVVISRAVDEGQTVAASLNAPVLFQIANDLTKMQIDSAVAEADVGGVQEGQSVDFTVDAYPYRTFHGVVTQVRNSPTTQNNVVTYDCVIGVTNADYKLKPGMTANVAIIIAKHGDVLKIPNGALRFRPPEGANVETAETGKDDGSRTNAVASENGGGERRGGFGQGRRGGGGGGRPRGDRQLHTVYVLETDANGHEKLRPVQIHTGISDGLYTEVLGGLTDGDHIVTGSISSETDAQGNNPFGGGFPRRRR
ncbi:MAG TPA: efflux RND transporter periplasmic adaptor subunit [Verrucomicrobiae bacterium]|nr:efflux RND transporter periplasmic adaptor subunit [Verrucomicrobiae bacterium]